MKFQIVFLSLFLAAAHARHEPKGKGLRGGDDRDLELVGSTVVPNGSSATINCGSGSQCCVTGSFKTINNVGSMTIAGGGSCHLSMSNGSLGNCESNPCSISCDGACNVVVKADSAGDGEGGGDGGHDNDGDYGYDNDDDGDGDNDDGDGDGDGGDNDGGNGK